MEPISVNFHVWKFCDLDCQYCYATFEDIRGHLSEARALELLTALRRAGCEKITFAGGEPTLCPWLGRLLGESRRLGLVTSVVTNGARLRPLIEAHAEDIDWIGLSVDSSSDATQARLGRGQGYVRRSLELFDLARERGIRLKLNTVVTALNHDEDMSEFVLRIRPDRWKVLQATPIRGQNDGRIDSLLIPVQLFWGFVERHRHLADEGLAPVPEESEAIRGSYVMIDPRGRFFGNAAGTHRYSDPILEAGVESALAQIDWNAGKFLARGGRYDWSPLLRAVRR